LLVFELWVILRRVLVARRRPDVYVRAEVQPLGGLALSAGGLAPGRAAGRTPAPKRGTIGSWSIMSTETMQDEMWNDLSWNYPVQNGFENGVTCAISFLIWTLSVCGSCRSRVSYDISSPKGCPMLTPPETYVTSVSKCARIFYKRVRRHAQVLLIREIPVKVL
jgi:hypothetical protein